MTETPKTILAVMQNQWFRDPEEVKRIYARWPDMRRQLIARFLFAGCRTGRVLKEVFGDRIRDIVWEEASKEFGGVSSSCFPADPEHLRAVLDEVRPEVVLAFGRIASDALTALVPAEILITGPHPTARGVPVMQQLERMRAKLDNRLCVK